MSRPVAWVHAGLAVSVSAVHTAVTAIASPSLAGLVAYVGGFATVILAVALATGLRILIGLAVAGLGVGAGLSLVGAGGQLRIDAVVAGVALLAVLELSHRSCESRRAVRAVGDVVAGEVASLAAVAAASVGVGVGLLLLAAGRPPGGSVTQAGGAVAVLGVVVVAALLADRRP